MSSELQWGKQICMVRNLASPIVARVRMVERSVHMGTVRVSSCSCQSNLFLLGTRNAIVIDVLAMNECIITVAKCTNEVT